MMQQPPNSHRLGLPWSGQVELHVPTLITTQFAVMSLNEQPWLQFTFAHAKSTFLPHNWANNKLNVWNRTIIPQCNKLRNVDQSQDANKYKFM